jgi:hypothetical protein
MQRACSAGTAGSQRPATAVLQPRVVIQNSIKHKMKASRAQRCPVPSPLTAACSWCSRQQGLASGTQLWPKQQIQTPTHVGMPCKLGRQTNKKKVQLWLLTAPHTTVELLQDSTRTPPGRHKTNIAAMHLPHLATSPCQSQPATSHNHRLQIQPTNTLERQASTAVLPLTSLPQSSTSSFTATIHHCSHYTGAHAHLPHRQQATTGAEASWHQGKPCPRAVHSLTARRQCLGPRSARLVPRHPWQGSWARTAAQQALQCKGTPRSARARPYTGARVTNTNTSQSHTRPGVTPAQNNQHAA